VRLTLSLLGRTVVDLCILEPDDDDDWGGSASTERDTGPQPFGFRPSPDPWPPSWE
jgi:hypothetical protein